MRATNRCASSTRTFSGQAERAYANVFAAAAAQIAKPWKLSWAERRKESPCLQMDRGEGISPPSIHLTDHRPTICGVCSVCSLERGHESERRRRREAAAPLGIQYPSKLANDVASLDPRSLSLSLLSNGMPDVDKCSCLLSTSPENPRFERN